jgi:hypothetical protein
LEKVQEAWHAMTAAVAATSPGLALSLKQAVLVNADDGHVTVSFPHTIHVDRVNHEKNGRVIREHLSEHLGQNVGVVAIHDPNIVVDLPPPAEGFTSMVHAAPAVAPSAPVATTPAASAPAKPKQAGATGNDLWDQMVSSF